ncbi:uncharacterized protein [Gossypium hirsutum]|uniref:Retrotransposon gag domain-containing protein n=1 Tax=Gossypium hirsutum TaxID=3635 RepID=A0A1U8HN02_GOSHI|nr:uncharacterized protein LOC107887684 [Gossypium hirsutum]
MDQRLERIEQMQREMQEQLQEQMQEQLAKIQQDMRDHMLESQKSMMDQLTRLLAGGLEKGKSLLINAGEDNKDPTYPPGFIPPHVPLQTEAPLRRPSVTVRPQHGPVDAGIPINFPSGLGNNLGDSSVNPITPDLDLIEKERMATESSKQLEDRCRWLEEKFRVLESAGNHQGIDAKDLSLDSLMGAAARWYNQLSRAKIGSWRDLAQAFMQQYNHVTDMTPDRITLLNMEKKPSESFRQYAQRWREIAMQVQPPLLEKETTILFINTLKAPFITHMIGNTTKSFSDMVMAGEMIVNAIRGGKIEVGETTKRSVPKKKENEVNSMSSYNRDHSRSITVNQPKVSTRGQQGSTKQESSVRQNFEKLQFTPIPMSYKELYQSLFDSHVVSPYYIKPLQPPYPKWYDSNAQCDYHVGVSGHSIENYTTFKKTVERLLEMGIVKFDDTPGTKSPLPNHDDKSK